MYAVDKPVEAQTKVKLPVLSPIVQPVHVPVPTAACCLDRRNLEKGLPTPLGGARRGRTRVPRLCKTGSLAVTRGTRISAWLAPKLGAGLEPRRPSVIKGSAVSYPAVGFRAFAGQSTRNDTFICLPVLEHTSAKHVPGRLLTREPDPGEANAYVKRFVRR